MKICDLTQFYSPVSGGVKRYLHQKRAYLLEHTGHNHLLVVPGNRDQRIVEDRLITYTIASPLVSRTSRYRALLRLGAVREILLAEKPDLIECGDPYQIAWQALKAGELLGARAVAFYHSHFTETLRGAVESTVGPKVAGWATALGRAYTTGLYNRFEKTLVPSPALAEQLAQWGINNTCSVDLGVDISVFKPGEDRATVRSRHDISDQEILLLYVGRLAPEKNTALLCQTMRLLPKHYHLLVVGDGQERRLVEKLAADRGKVTWLPYCADSEQLAAYYRACDLFVHPGVQETFGFVALESQACGTPVVGIRGSYMDRIIFSDQTHWAAENSASALAAAILAAPKGVQRQALAEQVARQFAWAPVFERLFEIYLGRGT